MDRQNSHVAFCSFEKLATCITHAASRYLSLIFDLDSLSSFIAASSIFVFVVVSFVVNLVLRDFNFSAVSASLDLF